MKLQFNKVIFKKKIVKSKVHQIASVGETGNRAV